MDFYTPAVNYLKNKTIPFTIASKRIKIFSKKFNQRGEKYTEISKHSEKSKTLIKRYQGKHK